MLRRVTLILLAALASLTLAQSAQAQSPADFYRGRSVNLIVGYSAGGGYDTYARVLARHLGKHIPGNPTIVVQNMPGAGSLKAANYLFNVAPKDGSVFGSFSRGMPMEPLIGGAGAQFDATKFAWIGSGTNEDSVFVTWGTSKIKTWADMLEHPFTVGGEGSGSDPDIYALFLRNVFGVKLRLITGYPGSAEIAIALERGEVDGRTSWSWSSLKSQRPSWVRDKLVNLPLQVNLRRGPELQNVPAVMEFANTERQKQMLKLVVSRQDMARPFTAPPGIPEDRKAALRKAFDDAMRDPELLAEMKLRGMEVNPVSGADLDKLVSELYATPPDIIAETRAAIGGS